MRSAPSVVVDLSGSRRWTLALAALGGAAAGAAVATLLAHLQDRVDFSSASASALIAIAVAAGGWLACRHAPHDRGRLGWDGAQWQLDGAPGRLQVMIDLGGWMLLCFEPADDRRRRRWLPVSDARVPQALGLRAAVYCRPLPDPNLPGRPPE
jgi:hypothetical protein